MGWKHTPNAHEFFPRCKSCLPSTPTTAQSQELVRPQISGPPTTLSSFALRPTLPAGIIPTSVATGDFNGDGHIDWVIPDGAYNNIWLYLGEGNGTAVMPPTLIPLTGSAPIWIVAVSLRGNGVLDLVVAEADSNTVGVLLGNGDGTFQPEVEYQLSYSPDYLVAADFNGDGKLDIVAGLNDTTDTLAMLPGNGQGQLGTPLYTPTSQQWAGNVLAAADLNGDGKPDLVVLDFGYLSQSFSGGAQVFLNNGNGVFTEGQQFALNLASPGIPSLEYFGVALADVNGDGCPDAVLADSYAFADVYVGNCQGTFPTTASATYAAGDAGAAVALADVNHDGMLDIVISGLPVPGPVDQFTGLGEDGGNLVCVLLGESGGHFAPARTYRGEPTMISFAVADLNGTGYPDIVTANEGSGSASVYINDGTGAFGNPQGEPIGYNFGTSNAPTSPFLIGDVNGDGSPDLVVLEWAQYSPGAMQITAMLNDGSGNFSAPIQSPAFQEGNVTDVSGFALGDFRNTGRLDVLAVTFGASFIYFAPNIGNGKFGPGLTSPIENPGAIATGDFNGDGKLDFVSVTEASHDNNQVQVQVYFGNGKGTFVAGPTTTFPNGDSSAINARSIVYAGDFNADGKLDILYWDGNGLYEFLGNGNGTFTGRLLFPEFSNLVVADLNHDGLPDIIALTDEFGNPQTFVPYISVFLGRPDGTFKYAETYTPYLDTLQSPDFFGAFAPSDPFPGVTGDFNGDGNLDIVVPQFTSRPTDQAAFLQIMYGNGDGTFTPTYDYATLNKFFVPQAAADVNGDGLADLIELDSYTASFNVVPSTPTANPLQLYFRTEPVTGPTGYGVVVTNEATSAPTTVSFTASDPNISVPAVTIPAGVTSQDFSFTVGSHFNPRNVFSIEAQIGTATATAYNFASGPPEPYIELEPTALLFQGTAGVASAPQTVTLKNLGSAPLPISSVTIAPYFNQTNDCGTQVPAGGSCSFQVAITEKPFLTFGEMGVWDNQYGLVQGVDLQAFGSSVQLYPCCLSFRQTLGTTSPAQVVTVANQTPTPVTIEVGSPHPQVFGFAQTNNCGTPLPPGGNCHVKVVFTPTEPSTSNATIDLYQNGALILAVSLTGTVGDFGVNCITPCNDTINAGETGHLQGFVNSVNGFTGVVKLTCSGEPAESQCTVDPPQVTAGGQFAKFAVSITTKANSSSRLQPPPTQRFGAARYTLFFASLALPALICVCARISFKGRTRLIILSSILILCSCGGGSGSGGGTTGGNGGTGGPGGGGGGGTGGGSGTPPGTYILTIKGQDAYGTTNSKIFALVVK
ncbi:MAG TPA: FG-GAP-like repeat-containing protein [Terriglobales bacterium]